MLGLEILMVGDLIGKGKPGDGVTGAGLAIPVGLNCVVVAARGDIGDELGPDA